MSAAKPRQQAFRRSLPSPLLLLLSAVLPSGNAEALDAASQLTSPAFAGARPPMSATVSAGSGLPVVVALLADPGHSAVVTLPADSGQPAVAGLSADPGRPAAVVVSEPVGSIADAHFADPARFSAMQQRLPQLGAAESESELTTRIAEAAKSIGEASMNSDSDHSLREQAGIWAFNQLRDVASQRAASEGEQLLSPYGQASVALAVDQRGNLDGSSAQLFTPFHDNYRYLTFGQLGIEEGTYGAIGNAGLGQRWMLGHWRLGYNAFIDQLLSTPQRRGSLGAEAWGEYLRLSANVYQPIGGWRSRSALTQQRMARGYDITTRGYLPFYRQLGASLRYEQYLGNQVDLFHSGNLRSNPTAVTLGINYTPVPLFTLSASHQEGDGGESQDRLALKMNYRIGVPLRRQLSADNVAAAQSLSGSRYDTVTRNNTPVMAFRQRKSLSVFLATPPWQLQPGETLPLRLQIRHSNPIRAVSWQGDTQALSLTPPADNRNPQGWSVIIPPWDATPGASNTYHLSVTLEDSQQQRVTSNWITLTLPTPVAEPYHPQQYDVLAP